MEKGKLSLRDLENILTQYTGFLREETLLNSLVGEDCSVIDIKKLNGDILLLSTDPITFTSKNIGRLAVIINSNDIYATRGEPFGILVTVLIPPSKEMDDFKKVMEDIHRECLKLKIQILGGHTEVTDVVNDIVVSISILGTSSRKFFVKTGGARISDKIFLTKTVGIEGTSVLLDECDNLDDVLSEEEIREAEYFKEKISIQMESDILKEFNISSMHDVTEGGLIGAMFEISKASKTGFRLFKENILVHNITRKVCNYYNKDVLRLISSGNLIFTASGNDEKLIISKFRDCDIECEVIGEVLEEGIYYLNENGQDQKLNISIGDSFFS